MTSDTRPEQADAVLREQLVRLLRGGNAHMTFEEMIADFPADGMNTVFPNGTYTPWHLLEHLRLAQEDILEFIRNPDYREREWPKDYWPAPGTRANEADWKQTIASFQRDMQTIEDLVMDPQTDLSARIPWGDGQTILREILLVADHNAYHTGEFAIMRQVMGTWGKGH